MGWIGVDLFFVLSGFLVSGLLFTEYKKYGNVRPKLFLIRRGFKIYPLFYFSIIFTAVLLLFFPDSYFFIGSKKLFLNHHGIATGFIFEALFLQSYFFGYWGHHWSLSVEEIFYFSLAALIYRLASRNELQNTAKFRKISLFVFVACLIMRIVQNIVLPNSPINYSAAHLRLDSLFAGVFVSYYYHFQYKEIHEFYLRYRRYLLLLILPLISFTPFINVLKFSFVKTIGFTLIYMAFSFLLMAFLFEANIGSKIKKIVSRPFYDGVARIGFYSYSIYLFHTYIVRFLVGENYPYEQYMAGKYTYANVLESFIIYYILSILLGIGVSRIFEMPMLRLRDKWFPKRAV